MNLVIVVAPKPRLHGLVGGSMLGRAAGGCRGHNRSGILSSRMNQSHHPEKLCAVCKHSRCRLEDQGWCLVQRGRQSPGVCGGGDDAGEALPSGTDHGLSCILSSEVSAREQAKARRSSPLWLRRGAAGGRDSDGLGDETGQDLGEKGRRDLCEAEPWDRCAWVAASFAFDLRGPVARSRGS